MNESACMCHIRRMTYLQQLSDLMAYYKTRLFSSVTRGRFCVREGNVVDFLTCPSSSVLALAQLVWMAQK